MAERGQSLRNWENQPLLSFASLIPERLLMAGHRIGRTFRRDYVGLTPQQIRVGLDQLSRLNPGPFGANFELMALNSIPCARIFWPERTTKPGIILLIHGGGFAFGSPRSHRALAVHLSKATGHEVWIPDYRLSPEHPFPSGLTDLQQIVEEMIRRGTRLHAIVGDSAGGNLAAALIQWMVFTWPDHLPNACAMLSPWLDLSPQSKSNLQDEEALSLFDRYDMLTYSGFYLQGHSPEDPMASPLRGSFEGFPRTYLEGSLVEYLWPDIQLGAEKLDKSGIELHFRQEPKALHGWQLFPDALPEAKRTLQALAEWLEQPAAINRAKT